MNRDKPEVITNNTSSNRFNLTTRVMMELKFLNSPDIIQEAAWITARKTMGNPFTPKIFLSYLFAEHSPIRRLVLSWRVRKMDRRVSTHFARHVHSPAFIGGSRPDWFDETQADNDHMQDSNCQALIDMMRKRLCKRTWGPTRDIAEELKLTLMNGDEYQQALGSMLVPNCVYRGGCPEGNRNCAWWSSYMDTFTYNTLAERYAKYNHYFRTVHEYGKK